MPSVRRQNRWYMKWARIVKLFVQENAEIGGDLDVEGTATIDLLHLDTSAGEPASPIEGDVWWADGVPNYQTPFAGSTNQMGQELTRQVRNTSGTNIIDGQACRVIGSSGTHPLIALAQADNSNTSQALGLATIDIDNNNNGLVLTHGVLHGVQTDGDNYGEIWNEGDVLYLSPTVAGGLTNIMPDPPDEVTRLGEVGDVHATNGTLEISVGTSTATWNGRYVLRSGDTMTGTLELLRTVYQPSAITSITAAGGITVTHAIMRIQGDGGPIDITANPQITAGIDGEYLILEGGSDTNTVTLSNGTGLHIHGPAVLKEGDHIIFVYNEGNSEWDEISRSFPATDKPIPFASPTGSLGTFYSVGFYDFGGTSDNFATPTNFGTPNAALGAHFAIVTGAVPGDEISITITGDSINDQGVQSIGDTEVITIPISTPVDSYFETAKKWNGQISIETTGGTPIACNYLFCKYWDNNNSVFTVRGINVTWRGGASDTGANIILGHHKATGWTFNAGSDATVPAPIADMVTDNTPNINIVNGKPGAWKRDDLLTTIDGETGEGVIITYITGANKSLEFANGTYTITPG